MMTKASDTIYCVQCLSVKPRTEAELVFRTGYYRVTTPLGQCAACASAEHSAAAASRAQAPDERGGSPHGKPA